jgi:hypothetical protein
LEGRLPSPTAALHGSAHIIGDRGFVFLFNPSHEARVAVVPINHWIGLAEGQTFEVSTLHPTSGTTFGPYQRGEELRIEVPSHGAFVLQVKPAMAGMTPRRPTLLAGAPVDKAFLKFEEIPWSEITPLP